MRRLEWADWAHLCLWRHTSCLLPKAKGDRVAASAQAAAATTQSITMEVVAASIAGGFIAKQLPDKTRVLQEVLLLLSSHRHSNVICAIHGCYF